MIVDAGFSFAETNLKFSISRTLLSRLRIASESELDSDSDFESISCFRLTPSGYHIISSVDDIRRHRG